eukprot:766692-Hanusia_phi.AAC.1
MIVNNITIVSITDQHHSEASSARAHRSHQLLHVYAAAGTHATFNLKLTSRARPMKCLSDQQPDPSKGGNGWLAV